MITFTIPGVPVAKGRPKFRTFMERGIVARIVSLIKARNIGEIYSVLQKGVKVSTYTPPKTRDAELALRLQVRRIKPRVPLSGALRVDLVFVVQKPLHIVGDRSEKWPHVKPDIENLAKLPLDAWNGIFWHDDGQICALTATKIYGTPPRTEVRISQLSDADESQGELWGGTHG